MPPQPKPFPQAPLENIHKPIDDIAQGDAYGAALLKAYDRHVAREEQLSTYFQGCDDKLNLEIEEFEEKQRIRNDLIDTLREELGYPPQVVDEKDAS